MELNISKEQRIVNIFNEAVKYGFIFNYHDSIIDTIESAECLLIEQVEPIQYHCELHGKNHNQYFDYSDNMGYDINETGYFVDFSEHWHDSPSTKVIYKTLVNSKAEVIDLYYLVGKTDYNQDIIE